MPGNDAYPSAAVETYLKKIIDDDINKKSGVFLSSFYTELSAELSVDDILPFTLGVIEKDEDRQHEYEILELVEKEKNLIISGISGSGKTTTLRWLNVIHAKKFLEAKDGLIPVFVELNSYVRGTFYDYVRICLSEKRVDTSSYKSMLNRNLLFLIDGLDLLSPSDNFPAYDEMLNFISEYSGCRYVISSRPGFFKRFRSRFKVSEFEELNDEKMKLFINKYVMDNNFVESLYDSIQSNEKLTSLFRNPLMLSLGIEVADIRRNDKKEIIHAELPDSQSKMYEAFIDHLFNHLDKKGKTLNANRVLIKETLADIYFRMQCRNRVSCKYDQALKIAEKHVKINEGKFTKTTTAEDILKDIFSLGLSNYNRSDSSVKYGIHQSFQEYFAALKLADCFKTGMDISQAFGHPRWENVVIFASEMFDSPDEFISSIISCGNLQLASKCAKKGSLHIKEELCFLLADGLDSRFLLDKTKAIESLSRFGELAISVIIAALHHENVILRWKAAVSLGEIKTEKAVDLLIATLSDENNIVRWMAAITLGKIKSEKAVDALIAELNYKNENVPWEAVIALGKIKSEKAVDALIAALSNEYDNVRWNAADVLGKIKSEKAVDALIAALSDENTIVRMNAVNALGEIKSEKAVDAVIAALSNENDTLHRSAAYALGNIRSEKAVDALIAALSHENEDVRNSAAYALGKIKSEKAENALKAALSHENEGVRRSVTYARDKINSEKEENALKAALSHENEEVRRSAQPCGGSA